MDKSLLEAHNELESVLVAKNVPRIMVSYFLGERLSPYLKIV